MLSKIADVTKSIITIFSFIVVLALLLDVGYRVIWPKPVVLPISVPDSLQKRGYSSDVLSQEMADGTREIARIATEGFDVGRPRLSIGAEQKIDAKIPGFDFTLTSAAQYISSLVGAPDNRIVGEVTQSGAILHLSLRQRGGRVITADIPPIEGDPDAKALIQTGSEMLMKLAHPYDLAAYYFNMERSGSQYPLTIETLNEMLTADLDPYWAHNLLCVVDFNKGDASAATSECGKAITIDSANWPAHANLGFALYTAARGNIRTGDVVPTAEAKKNCSLAIEQFEIADGKHKITSLYGEWAQCLKALGRTDEAAQLLEKKRTTQAGTSD